MLESSAAECSAPYLGAELQSEIRNFDLYHCAAFLITSPMEAEAGEAAESLIFELLLVQRLGGIEISAHKKERKQ